MIASVTLVTPSSWPITLLWSCSSRLRVFCLSDSLNLLTGIPVHLDIILAISSSVTLSWTRLISLLLDFFSASSKAFCACGSLPYWSSAALLRSYSLLACAIWVLIWSISSFNLLTWSTEDFSLSHLAFWILKSDLNSDNSFCNASSLSLLRLSVSFLRAASSISSCMIFLESSSSSVGMESSSVLIIAHASSTRSMALSGRKRSLI